MSFEIVDSFAILGGTSTNCALLARGRGLARRHPLTDPGSQRRARSAPRLDRRMFVPLHPQAAQRRRRRLGARVCAHSRAMSKRFAGRELLSPRLCAHLPLLAAEQRVGGLSWQRTGRLRSRQTQDHGTRKRARGAPHVVMRERKRLWQRRYMARRRSLGGRLQRGRPDVVAAERGR
jgi:hypothetical protein